MARRNDHSREELEKIALKAAIDIVKKEGAQALTARSLAKAIGYTPGTLYNLFGSMDALWCRMNGITLDRLHEAVTALERYDEKAGVVENLKTMAKIYMDFAEKNKELWLLIFHPSQSQTANAPEWYRQKIKDEFDPLEKALEPLFAKKSTQEKKLAAQTLWSSVHGICLMQVTGKISPITDKSASDLSDYLIGNFFKDMSA